MREKPSPTRFITSRSGDQPFHSPQMATWVARTAAVRVKVTDAVPHRSIDLIITPPRLADPCRTDPLTCRIGLPTRSEG